MDELDKDLEFYVERLSYYSKQIDRYDLALEDSQHAFGFASGFGEIAFSLSFDGVNRTREFWRKGLTEFVQKAIKNAYKEGKNDEVLRSKSTK